MQKSYLDKIEQAKNLENNSKYLEAYLEIVDIDSNECLIHPNFGKYKEELKNRNILAVEQSIGKMLVSEAYLYLKGFPIKLENKIEEYKSLIIKEANEKIKNITEK